MARRRIWWVCVNPLAIVVLLGLLVGLIGPRLFGLPR
jgi:hypothetical protein